jgi:AcrR family transcriptional regulator
MDESRESRPRGRVAKRLAIMRAARTTFARDGYSGAGIETIAAAASVSPRTIYNHFDNKEQLFTAVLRESSDQVADHLCKSIERHLGGITGPADVEGALVALALAWTSPQTEFAEHFAMVRRIYIEAAHLPAALIDAWHTSGPGRAERDLSYYLRKLGDRDLLARDGADRAAEHLLLLTVGAIANRTYIGTVPLDGDETRAIVTSGVRTFLRGHLQH